jgi:serine/threonine protein kinase
VRTCSDIYSFGIMMHALYTGEQPFSKLLYGQFFETVVVNDLRWAPITSIVHDSSRTRLTILHQRSA